MDLIVEMRFGSHLYGTDTSHSDLDFKAVYLPEAMDILLQRVKGAVSTSRDKQAGEKNRPEDVDRDVYALQRYLELLAEGQTVALDMLFAPDAAMARPPALLWREIQANRALLVTRRAGAFVRYCRQQANKYGIKGSRVAASRHALAVLVAAVEKLGTSAKLGSIEADLVEMTASGEHSVLVDLPTPGGGLIRHLEVCGRKMPFTSSIKSAREIVQRLVDEYGQRALQAERNEGVDWKALSHAVRVGREALELFQTGTITFPLSYAAEILRIKRGLASYEEVAETIEVLLAEVEAAAVTSSLREEPDHAFIKDLVARAHRAKVMGAS